MALGSLLVLLDDIAAVLDDVALMTRVAAEKTAGVLGDDLAVNAEKVTGIAAQRELPVVRAVALGSLRNKCILVPGALLLSAWVPAAITPLLLAGGLYLCYEGAEKLWHALRPSAAGEHREREERLAALKRPETDALALERDKIRGAVRTDFILSAEIIVITLGIVAQAPLPERILVLSAIALIMTVGVYGLVAIIVKLDDIGLVLARRQGAGTAKLLRSLGRGLLAFAPRLMRGLTVVGTVAMFLVGGGILVHNVALLHHGLEHVLESLVGGLPAPGARSWLAACLNLVLPGLAGVFAGLALLVPVSLWTRTRGAQPG